MKKLSIGATNRHIDKNDESRESIKLTERRKDTKIEKKAAIWIQVEGFHRAKIFLFV